MLKKLMMSAVLATAAIAPLAQAQLKYLPNRDYTILQQNIDPESKPRIVEFFWYGCPHCYDFESHLSKWRNSDAGKSVTFVKVPAITGRWEPAGQLYYTAHALNLPDIDRKVFDAVHKEQNLKIIFEKDAAIDFLVANGANRADAEKAWDSLDVKQKMKRAKKLFDDSQFNGVPSILVNGVYTVNGTSDFDRLLDVATMLAKKPLMN